MSVVLYPTDVTTIRTVQDQLANMLASSIGTWTLELKFYKSNPASFQKSPAEFIYTVSSNQDPDSVSLFTKDEALVTDNQLQPILLSKLKSLWTLRQTHRVEGEAYKLDDLEIRVGNAFLSGSFKALVVQISTQAEDREVIKQQVNRALEQLNIKAVADEFEPTKLGIERQYHKLNK